MTYPTDIPLRRPGASPCEPDFYVLGNRVWIRPRPSPSGGMDMGGPVAEAADADSAATIAHRCTLFEPLLAALKEQAKAKTRRLEVAGISDDEITGIMAPLRDLIARAEGR